MAEKVAGKLKWKMNMKFFLFLLVVYFDVHYCQSYLNVEELSSMKYGVEITNKPVIFQENPSDNEIYLSSKFGQPYSCLLPRNIGLGDDKEDVVAKDPYSVVDLLDRSLNGTCLTHHKGWWSYKVCHKDKIEQFHLNEKSKAESITSLGVYESEDDWEKREESESHPKNLYHAQKYVNGSICDLTNKPRKTTVQYYCSSSNTDSIIRVEEPSTCEYIITIHSKELCKHSLFQKKEKSTQIPLVCSPVLSEKDYQKYMEKVKKEESKKESKKEVNKETEMTEEKGEKGEPKWRETAKEVQKFMKGFMNVLSNIGGKGSKFQPYISDLEVRSLNSPEVKKESEKEDVENEMKEDQDEVATDSKEEIFSKKQKNEDLKKTKELKKKALNDIEKTKRLNEEIEELRKGNEKLYEDSRTMRNAFENQYEVMRKLNIDKQREIREDIKALEIEDENAETEEERTQIEKKIENLKTEFEATKRKLGEMHKVKNEMKNIEERASTNLQNLNEQIQDTEKVEKMFSNVFSDFPIEEKEISDTMKNLFKKANEEAAKILKMTENEDLIDENVENDDEVDNDKDDEEEIVSELDNEDKHKENEKKLADLLEKNMKLLNDKKEELKEELSEDLREVVDETEKQLKDSMQVRVRKFDGNVENEFEGVDEKLTEEVKLASKKMENAVKEQLRKAGIKLSDNIKVKIITSKEKFDKLGKGEDLLTNEQASQFKDVLMGFLGGGKEKKEEEKRQKELEENYSFQWNNEEPEDSDKREIE